MNWKGDVKDVDDDEGGVEFVGDSDRLLGKT